VTAFDAAAGDAGTAGKGTLRSLSTYGIAIFGAVGVISVFTALLGYDLFKVIRTLLFSSFRSVSGFRTTIRVAIPLIFTTYAFALPFKIKFFNTGGWGQMLFGGTVTAAAGIVLISPAWPSQLAVPALVLTGILAGGCFGLIAGALKAYYDINPIVSTIMLNYVAVNFVSFICTTPPFIDPRGGHPQTVLLPKTATLGFIGGIPHSLILAVCAVLFMFLLLTRTKLGYEITAIGHNLTAAQSFGIDFKKTVMKAFFIGGALAGLGGALEVINIHGRLLVGFAEMTGANYGALGVLTALIVTGNPLGVPLSAFSMSILLVGADRLQRTLQVPGELVFLTLALVVLLVVITRARFTERYS
jgi:ABC-type uncharacterized transport system permease subunit